jgi:hypothetical protein
MTLPLRLLRQPSGVSEDYPVQSVLATTAPDANEATEMTDHSFRPRTDLPTDPWVRPPFAGYVVLGAVAATFLLQAVLLGYSGISPDEVYTHSPKAFLVSARSLVIGAVAGGVLGAVIWAIVCVTGSRGHRR